MTDREWVKIISWHVQSGVTSRGGMLRTVCGRWAAPHAEASDTLPAGKSCESCLRITAREDDR